LPARDCIPMSLGVFSDDISSTILERVHRGVSLDTNLSRIALLAESPLRKHGTPTAQLELFYAWLGRIEPTDFRTVFAFEPISKSAPSRGVETSCGPLTAFVSGQRDTALALCGWSPLCTATADAAVATGHTTLSSLAAAVPVPVVQSALNSGDVERAAALSLLHGLVEVAVQILTFAADDARSPSSGRSGTLEAELLQLTAMAIAGCPGPTIPVDGGAVHVAVEPSRRVWLTSCRILAARIDGAKHPYLKVMLTVLLEVADPLLVPQPWPAHAGESRDGVPSPESSRRRQAPQRNWHNLETGVSSPFPMPDLSIGESAIAVSHVSGEGSRAALRSFPNAASSPVAASLSPSFASPMSTSGGGGSEVIPISLHDRMAFACRFLSDDALHTFVSKIQEECLEAGRVDGLMVTGPSPAGARLVQRYLDRSGDIQTAAMAGCFFLRAIQVCP
jgi:hypothetical protein